MQIIFKAITGSSGYAFWWERTTLHSMETVVMVIPTFAEEEEEEESNDTHHYI